ncbi:beta-3-deoxy-D-manno-oct-2-ulosonic acid transferase [uncultured Sphingomonas sp.]|uniref:capsular polysaccharide export protein, LipB/KpsS family n=1 Tax=uncultured Sphingomonas sp. TaxID=158754 RepID=UPI0025D0CC27|nr:beta-3-deoxy-D-manno-oct-2-ulosonic acid transferase [uncultured Sphingomonas sp.]
MTRLPPELTAPHFPWLKDKAGAVAHVDQAGVIHGRDPFTGATIPVEAAAAIAAHWRALSRANAPIRVATGMAWWKRQRIAQFLWAEGHAPLTFADDAEGALSAAAGGRIATWPSRAPAGLAGQAGERLVRVEDGFIRSIGLGADLHPPLSIVVDQSGIYYDPTRPSDLETILQTADFTPDLLARAAALRTLIVERGISKYASAAPLAPAPRRTGKRVVLVPGQVEDDQSVRLGGAGIASNLDLLARARAAEPDAYILFKPHPDVDAGHRVGRVPDADLLAHADEVVRGEAMPALLGRVDAVHVLTSLTGFEALLRGLDVTVHGHPFFAGWGLTRDLAGPLPRRTRRLDLDALVAGALILYPRYLDPMTELPCPPEVLLRRFADGWRPRETWLIRARRVQGRIARALGTVSR